jgi:hypothetical protein
MQFPPHGISFNPDADQIIGLKHFQGLLFR